MPDEEEKPDQFKEFAEKMLGAVEALGARIEAVETNVSTQNANLKTIQDNTATPPKEEPKNPTLAEMDLESMSRSELASAIAQTVVAEVQKTLVQPISEQVGSVQNNADEQSLRNEFGEVASANTDFALYKDVMLGMLDTHKHLSVKEMYVMAKNDNPDIATTEAKRVAEANPDANKGDAFGGLTPTSGSTIQNKGEASAVDAAEEAWNDTMTGSPLAEAQ